VFEIDDKEISMGEGQASKVLIERDGEFIQINYLGEGDKAKISNIIGGDSLKEKFELLGMVEGKEITLVRKETSPPSPKRACNNWTRSCRESSSGMINEAAKTKRQMNEIA
jgi:Fe2+ transport system protein FeoA